MTFLNAGWIRQTFMSLGALTLSGMGLAGCAIATPATITSTQSALGKVLALTLNSEDKDQSLRAGFRSSLSAAFEARGVELAEETPFYADFAVSARTARLTALPATDDAKAPQPGFKSRWYHTCKPDRVTASLVIYTKADNTVHARSSGEFLACPGELNELTSLAQLLVDQALSQ